MNTHLHEQNKVIFTLFLWNVQIHKSQWPCFLNDFMRKLHSASENMYTKKSVTHITNIVLTDKAPYALCKLLLKLTDKERFCEFVQIN